jgi:hypothetical protein
MENGIKKKETVKHVTWKILRTRVAHRISHI